MDEQMISTESSLSADTLATLSIKIMHLAMSQSSAQYMSDIESCLSEKVSTTFPV
jgi:hypothetical protein